MLQARRRLLRMPIIRRLLLHHLLMNSLLIRRLHRLPMPIRRVKGAGKRGGKHAPTEQLPVMPEPRFSAGLFFRSECRDTDRQPTSTRDGDEPERYRIHHENRVEDRADRFIVASQRRQAADGRFGVKRTYDSHLPDVARSSMFLRTQSPGPLHTGCAAKTA